MGIESKIKDTTQHPEYYNRYSIEVVEMVRRIFFAKKKYWFNIFCEATAFIYRMRMGLKPENDIAQEMSKESFWLSFVDKTVDMSIEDED